MSTQHRTRRGTPAPQWVKPLMLTAALLLAACGDTALEGNGDVVTESRIVSNFEAVDATNGVQVILTIDPTVTGDVTLAVTTDSNLQEFLTTEVTDGTLRTSPDRTGGVTSSGGFNVSGTVAGMSDVVSNDGARVEVVGAVGAITLSADGGGRIEGESLEATNVTVEAADGAQIRICASGAVTGDVTNGADLTVLCGGDVSGVETSDGGGISTQ